MRERNTFCAAYLCPQFALQRHHVSKIPSLEAIAFVSRVSGGIVLTRSGRQKGRALGRGVESRSLDGVVSEGRLGATSRQRSLPQQRRSHNRGHV